MLAGGTGGAWEVARLDLAPVPGGEVLDPSFGSGGLVTHDLGGVWDRISRTLELGDGRLLSVGSATLGLFDAPAYYLALVRTLADGTPDPAFGDGGRVLIPAVEPVADLVHVGDAALLPDEKLLVVGLARAGTEDEELLLVRLTQDGAPDATFGTDGFVRLDLSGGLDYASSLAVQPDGRFAVAAQAGTTGARLLRFLDDGTLDPTFGEGGMGGLLPFSSTGRIAELPDGRFILSGSFDSQPALARLDADGTLDLSFGEEGIAALDGEGWFSGPVELPDGRLVAGGTMDVDGRHGVLARFTPDGALDPSFGDEGLVILQIGDAPMYNAYGLAPRLLPGGRLLVAGRNATGPPLTGMFAFTGVLTPNGAPDPAFGEDGWLILNLSYGDETISDVRLLADGSALLSGSDGPPNRDILLVRFDPGSGTLANEPDATTEVLAFDVYPNPARDAITVSFETGAAGAIKAEVFDLLGRRVARLADGPHTTGRHTLRWTTASLPSGVYVLRLSTAGATHTHKLTVVR